MIRFNKLPDNILDFLPAAVEYLETNPKIIFSYLFGSLAKGLPSPLSDVDIAVYLADTSNIPDDKLIIIGGLIDILQTDEIDLVIINIAGLPMIMNVLRNKKILVDKVPFARHTFESLMMRKYFDFSIKESAQLKRRFLNG